MRSIILLVTMLIVFLNVKAQDVITLRSGEDIPAKILEVSPTEIKYRKRGGTYTLNKSDISMIRYKGGRKEYFDDKPAEKEKNTTVVKVDTAAHRLDSAMADRGRTDAKLFYKKYKTAESWTMAATWLTSPIGGVIPAVACSVTPPKDKNLNCPHPDLLNNREYGDAYRDKARRIKAGRTWAGFGYGCAIYAVLITFIKVVVK